MAGATLTTEKIGGKMKKRPKFSSVKGRPPVYGSKDVTIEVIVPPQFVTWLIKTGRAAGRSRGMQARLLLLKLWEEALAKEAPEPPEA